MKIPTKGSNGRSNGYVVPVWNANEQPNLRPDQVYMTAVAPGTHKGPHLHKIRRGLFCCVRGNVRIVTRSHGAYQIHYSGDRYDYASIHVEPGVAACIYNDDAEVEALVLNMPLPAWAPDQRDEWPVEDWVA